MHGVAISVIFNLKLFHPKHSTKSKPDTFVTKEKRGRKSKKALWRALDEPKTMPKNSSTPKSTPERPVKKIEKRKLLS